MTQTMIDLFTREKEDWLEGARATARKLLVNRGEITINDVLHEYPRPQWVHRNTTGQVFKHRDFKTCGFEKSTAKLAKGRIICRWTLSPDLKQVLGMLRREPMEMAD